MFIQPVYNILLLPDVTYYFKKDFFADRADELKPGTQLLFASRRSVSDDVIASGTACPGSDGVDGADRRSGASGHCGGNRAATGDQVDQ